jgi:hypothetical protein
LDKPFETHALHQAIAQILDSHAVSGTWLTAQLDEAVDQAG